jgi:hypothetical protein
MPPLPAPWAVRRSHESSTVSRNLHLRSCACHRSIAELSLKD